MVGIDNYWTFSWSFITICVWSSLKIFLKQVLNYYMNAHLFLWVEKLRNTLICIVAQSVKADSWCWRILTTNLFLQILHIYCLLKWTHMHCRMICMIKFSTELIWGLMWEQETEGTIMRIFQNPPWYCCYHCMCLFMKRFRVS